MSRTSSPGGRHSNRDIAWEEDGGAPFNPAWILVGFTLLIIAAGTLLLSMPFSTAGRSASLIEAFFTAASAATTTGLTVVDTASFWSFTGQNVILWLFALGGVGSVISSTMLLLIIASRIRQEDRFLLREFSGMQSARGMVLLIVGVLVYAAVVQLAGYYLISRELGSSMPVAEARWLAFFHASSSFNNAGFELMGMAQRPPSASVQLTLTALSFLGALGFIIVLDLFRGVVKRRLSLDTKLALTATTILFVLGAIVIFAGESRNPGTLGPSAIGDKVLAAVFHSVSMRTTGMATADLGLFVNGTLLIVIAFMFVGGASGSTAGGIKVNTLAVLAAVTWSFVRGRRHASAFGNLIDEVHVNRAMAIVFLAGLLVFGVTLALSMLEDLPLLSLLFEAVSSFSTTGLSMGVTSELTTAGKLLIIFTMFAGKVGPVTLAFAISRRQKLSYETYAEETVNLG
ncbi:MAG: Trk family potassium uptake protein [Chloroflexi bacterium]|nr:Trk family potassium uptake protein [Chloroflexota bacterium]